MRGSGGLPVPQPLEVCTAGKPAHHASRIGEVAWKPLMSTRFADFIRDVAEPTDLRPWLWHQWEGKSLFLVLRCGPTIIRGWSPDGREIFKALSFTESFSMALTLQVDRVFPSRISLMISGLSQFRKISALSVVRWNWKFSQLVPNNASSFEVVRKGDFEALQMLLDLGKTSVSDVITSGDTLLHVRFFLSHFPVRSTHFSSRLLRAGTGSLWCQCCCPKEQTQTPLTISASM